MLNPDLPDALLPPRSRVGDGLVAFFKLDIFRAEFFIPRPPFDRMEPLDPTEDPARETPFAPDRDPGGELIPLFTDEFDDISNLRD
jgi:hypothetical protein